MSHLTAALQARRLLFMQHFYTTDLIPSARTACAEVLKLKSGERVLIITNPRDEVLSVSHALYDAALALDAEPVLLVQPVKTQMDYADPAVLAALKSEPDVAVSISAEKIGKDPDGLRQPYRHGDREYDHIFDYLMNGRKLLRAFWSPGMTRDMFRRALDIDYGRLKNECAQLIGHFNRAVSMRVSCSAGTDILLGLNGRFGEADDGDFSRPGSGGNLPAGEAFASPELETASGTIVFRGSISLYSTDILITEPVTVGVSRGFVTSVEGGAEAAALRETLARGESKALAMSAEGSLPRGMGEVYRRNARAIGEIGIGLNPSARVTGNMLEDEKAYRTCHLAVGANYADDSPALIHCDGLVIEPTISFRYPDGEERTVMREGKLSL
jgi:aminopeptidase